jgi:methyl-accepting chemotaxis protein
MKKRIAYRHFIIVGSSVLALPSLFFIYFFGSSFANVVQLAKNMTADGISAAEVQQAGQLLVSQVNAYQHTFDNLKVYTICHLVVVGFLLVRLLATRVEAINSTLKSLAHDIHKGHLHCRGTMKALTTDFAEIMDNVNGLIESFVSPIKEAMNVITCTANHDLTARVTGQYEGELGKFKNDINAANQNLSESIQNVAEVSQHIATVAHDMEVTSHELAGASSRQAAALTEIAESISSINEVTEANAQVSREAADLSTAATEHAEGGMDSMRRMILSMNEISQAADRIAKIISVIDGIAFQTNLLALNAAVEAAHAGQHGMGFAVVAEEVRNLAGRSAEAARETKGIIEDTLNKVKSGMETAQTTSSSLGGIAEGIKKINESMAVVASSSQEQMVRLGEMGRALADVRGVTELSSRSSTNTAQTAKDLAEQTMLLDQLVKKFKVG